MLITVGGLMGARLLMVFLLETFGVSLTKASNASFLISLFIVFTPLIEWRLFGNRPTPLVIAVAVLAVIGVAMITGVVDTFWATSVPAPLPADDTASHGWLNLGDGLIILAGLMRAIATVVSKKLLNHAHIALPHLSMLGLTALQSWVVAIGCGILASVTTPSWQLPPLTITGDGMGEGWLFWGSLGYLMLFCTLFAFLAQNFAIKHTSPSRVSILLGSEPIFGAVFAVLWLGESLSLTAWLGGLLILVSCLLICTKSVKN